MVKRQRETCSPLVSLTQIPIICAEVIILITAIHCQTTLTNRTFLNCNACKVALHVSHRGHFVSHHHFPCLNSSTGFQLITESNSNCPLFHIALLQYINHRPYLASILHFSNIPRQLRYTSQQLSIPRTKLNLGKRAFSVAAPIIWNELPTTLKYCESFVSFRKHLKTYLFKIAFPP